MRLLQLEVENFMCFKHAELPLDRQGLVLVIGNNTDGVSADSNGAGKSALFVDAIPWALYGETVREKVFGRTSSNFKVDDVVNLSEGKDCRARVVFSRGKVVYEVERFRSHSDEGNTVRLTTSKGADLTCESVAETNRLIVQLLGMSYEAYCHSAVFAQGAMRRFTQCTDGERRRILEEFFDLGVFDKARGLALDERKEVEAQLLDLTTEERSVASLIDLENKNLTELQRLKGTLHSRADLLAEKTVAAELKVLARVCSELEGRLLPQKESADLDVRLRKIAGELGGLQARRAQLQRDFAKCSAMMKKFKPGDTCPECSQKVDVKHWKEMNLKLHARLEELENELGENAQSCAFLNEHSELYTKRLEDDRKLRLELSAALHRKAISSSQHSSLVEARETAEKQASEFDRSLVQAKRSLAKLRNRAGSLALDIRNLTAHRDVLRFWCDGFGSHGIKEHCYERLIGFLNSRLGTYAQHLTGGEILVGLERTPSDKIAVNVTVERGAATYQMSSGGQGRRVDLCIALALQSAVEGGEKINYSVIDEFDAGLDATGVDAFVDFLRMEAAQRGSVFVITHNSHMAGMFDSVVTVKRTGGFSTLERV